MHIFRKLKKEEIMNKFEEIIKGKSYEELVVILTNMQEFNPEFVEAVRKELKEVRNINSYDVFFSRKTTEELVGYNEHSKMYNAKFNELVINELKKRNFYVDTVGYKHSIEGIFGQQTDCLGQPVPTIPVEAASDLEPPDEEFIKYIYDFAHNLLFKEKRNREEVINALVNKGIDKENAEDVVDSFITSRKERAAKDMLFGALWSIGGTIATMADLGYIFWGAIVFGVIQFFRGLINHS